MALGKEAAGGGSSAAAPSQAHLKQRPPPAHPTVPLLSGCLMHWIYTQKWDYWVIPGGTIGKGPTCQCWRHTGDVGLIPGSEGSPGGGHSNPHQSSCVEHPMDRGAWRAAVRGVGKEGNMTWRLNSKYLLYQLS